jgi:CDP-diacylglycerol--glycerol-3-phosphate 3-phosphatidyltransferase
MQLNLPTALTWARIVMIPLFVGVYYLPEAWLQLSEKNLIATWLFLIASITDWFDGYLARALRQTSEFGAFLDPVADKLMVMAALVMLVQLGRVDALIAVVIIGREITISALREWMAKLGAASNVAVAFIGKIKTTAQMAAIVILIYGDNVFSWPIQPLGSVLIYVAALLTLWSMGYYLRRAAPLFNQDQRTAAENK